MASLAITAADGAAPDRGHEATVRRTHSHAAVRARSCPMSTYAGRDVALCSRERGPGRQYVAGVRR